MSDIEWRSGIVDILVDLVGINIFLEKTAFLNIWVDYRILRG